MRTLAVARRVMRQFARDPRTLGLIVVAPVLVLTLLSAIFKTGEYRPRLAVLHVPAPIAEALRREGATATEAQSELEAARALRDGRVDAVVSLEGGRARVRVEGSDPSVTRAVLHTVSRVVASSGAAGRAAPGPEVSYLHGSAAMTAFDNFGPVLLGFLVFFFVYLTAGVSFVRERTTGTLERMLATPVRRWEIVAGYALGFSAVVVVQAAVIALYSVYVLKMLLVGSMWLLLLVVLLQAATALTLGMLLSAFARNEFQLIQFIPLVIVPQVFFSGLFNLDAMAPWLRGVGRALPLTYGGRALREVMVRGGGWNAVARDAFTLLAFAAAMLAINVVALRKYRKL